jgi:hypothetical protein
MQLWKKFSANGGIAAAALVLLWVGLLATAILKEGKQQPWRDGASYGQNQSYPTAAVRSEAVSSHSKNHGHESTDQNNEASWSWRRFFFETNVADAVIALFTVVLAWSTHRLWDETKRIRVDSEQTVRSLERAYIVPRIGGAETERLVRQLDNGATRSDDIARLEIVFAFVNFGKTPGTILFAEGKMRHKSITPPANARPQIITDPILAATAGTNDLRAVLVLSSQEAASIIIRDRENVEPLIFEANITFNDVFGFKNTDRHIWEFNRQTRTFAPVISDHQEEKMKA